MERNYESPDRRIARVQAMIDDIQLVPVLPRRFTNRMLERWYKERPTAHVTWRWFDRTVIVLALALGIVNLLPR
jgi:hypothetical protein